MSGALQNFGSFRLSFVRKEKDDRPPTSQSRKPNNKCKSKLSTAEAREAAETICLVARKEVGVKVGDFNAVEDSAGSCVICVGSTGAGKSSTIAKYTGSRTKSGSGSERVTKNCEIHRCIQDDNLPVWVDTVGWDDAECEDDETFKDILRFIDKYSITKVKCVIWNISPNVRCDALLTGQARLINMFQEKIWSNVLIVCKQSLNPDLDCQGALKAAQKFSSSNIPFTGYRFYEDPTLTPKQREVFICPETRQTYNVKTDPEVHEILDELLAQLGPPVQVVFNTKRCIVCGEQGDARLLSSFCHMEDIMIHPGLIQNHHPGGTEAFHPSSHHVIEHDGRLKKNWYSAFCCGTLRRPRYTCCRRRSGKEGCKKKWACCKAKWDTRDEPGCQFRYSCCRAPVSANNCGCSPRYACCLLPVNTAGCKKVCKKCGSEWGSPANGCFRKDHTLAEISETKREELTEENKKEGIIGGNSEQQDEKFKDQGEVEDGRTNQFKHLPPIITYHMF